MEERDGQQRERGTKACEKVVPWFASRSCTRGMYFSESRSRSWSSVTMKRMFGFVGVAGAGGAADAIPDPRARAASRDRKVIDGRRTGILLGRKRSSG